METQKRFRPVGFDYTGTIGNKEYVITTYDSETGKLHAKRVVNGNVVHYINIIANPTDFCTLTLCGIKHYKVENNGQVYFKKFEVSK